MKLTDLLKEENIAGMEVTDENVMMALKNILRKWSNTQYANDKERSDDFFLDIKELIEDFEEEEVINYPTNLQNVNLQEGTCGYSVDGEGGDEPAGPHLLRKAIKQEISRMYEDEGFDSKLSDLMGQGDFEKATNPKLSKLISNAIATVDADLSYMDFGYETKEGFLAQNICF